MDIILIALVLVGVICAGAMPRKAREYFELVNIRTKEKRRV
ncbi:hypothetical protein [Sporomusa acidovorans]|uniref:Uncharacterized protein n=1 Tax=Sporomusa acidovorans (strain ATCC 49682 / DSM 3132 / Mol) TaxID=1123286 RepID=A0ABZ3J7C7_SPOA4|nr:hypothetical protein [Sporomusa acidovorans]OZC24190.1 hypothetical protein SPACI_01650 [Sporomusa acidovorans DSM 3132]SDF77636.1 hypothetical protein SAMN04488499_10818 [Sporomusa acidovorans]